MNAILNHPIFVQSMQKNKASESDRPYCKHGLAHALDVARIAMLINMEEALGFSKDVVYAVALLHDVTKWQQYLIGIPHHESAIAPATAVLRDCGFTVEETTLICDAIRHHRDGPPDNAAFARLIFRADKLSRACFSCDSGDTCNWGADKKNTALSY